VGKNISPRVHFSLLWEMEGLGCLALDTAYSDFFTFFRNTMIVSKNALTKGL
jgi:hypothetical protein